MIQCHAADMPKLNWQIISTVLVLQMSCSISFFPIYPEQIHLAIGDAPLEMVVTWVTYADTKASFVWYGKISDGLTKRAEGCAKKYAVEKNSRRVRFIHRVAISDLEPCSYYAYRCGSWYGASEPFIFRTPPIGTDWSPKLIIYGDMGWKGAYAFPYILNEAKNYDVDAVVHVGDIAYDLPSKDGYVGDQFMKMIQPLASFVPYMTTVGNHEHHQNFSHYKNIFSMPGKNQGMFYSFDLGPAHFIAISTEVYYFTQYGVEPIKRQFEWLQKDLKKAAKKRRERPWIIVFAHRPMYCSSDDGEDCSLSESLLRCSYLFGRNYGLENLFHKYGVDIIFSGHMHYYERSWPIFNKNVYNGSCTEPYRNARAAVHIITGAAGMKSGTESASNVRRDLFGFFSNEYSFTIFRVFNKSISYMEQVSATRNGQVIDAVYFVKELKR